MKPKFINRLFTINNVKTLGERIGMFFMILCLIFFMLTLIIFGISFFFKNDWIVHEIIQLISGVCLTFVFCSIFITLIFMTRNWIWKLLGVFITIAFFYASTQLMVNVKMIYKDKIALMKTSNLKRSLASRQRWSMITQSLDREWCMKLCLKM